MLITTLQYMPRILHSSSYILNSSVFIVDPEYFVDFYIDRKNKQLILSRWALSWLAGIPRFLATTPKVLLAACAAMDAFISVALIVNKLTVCLCVKSS